MHSRIWKINIKHKNIHIKIHARSWDGGGGIILRAKLSKRQFAASFLVIIQQLKLEGPNVDPPPLNIMKNLCSILFILTTLMEMH